MPTFEHEGMGIKLVIKDDLLQKDLEAFNASFREFNPLGSGLMNLSEGERWGVVVRAALAAGWIEDPAELDVGETPVKKVRWYARHIDEVYRELIDIPPN